MVDATSALPAPAPEADAREARRKAHVLVVDDEPTVRAFLEAVLVREGYRVTTAPNGPEAVRAVATDPPQVMLTDLRMEGMSGQELIARVKSVHPETVPLVITGYGTVEDAVSLVREGVFDVLTKPCPAAEVVSRVARAVEHHEALQANADLRARLRVQEKLAMIGKLAAGVAHELNNPLDATLRCVRLALDRASGDAETAELLGLARTGLQRMADIVKSLLTFSRQAAVDRRLEPLRRLVEEAQAAVSLALSDACPAIRASLEAAAAAAELPRAMHQVLVNLLRNAADATGPSGRVDVLAAIEGDALRIEVRDDGPGMPPEVLRRVFEPFFTTKPPGKGTGLGLPISARILEKFGGSIAVECPAAGGTVVKVSLPASPAARAGAE